ncbi:4-hydroxy-tetrahydrodipicolinate synthase [Paenibacillus sp. D2_2]|uniref:4-hydroxy-tetrahydrodipicolinate synthase n=1 Tax=Paenibacillus sp. D2_2 TaxID=3073092 RepID=UPI002814B49C|nr:4-hydroxy-tetrahydrodipicolinate synthase [Paenibacillus sp. D2_2]WMT39147.1 4-hydroxy-tetrahydrodipicolinate synthase [Paenibacillus sp. D2_2]
MDFGRLITAMVTPFDEQNRIHWGETARLIDYLIEEQKSDSLVVCGTTGESPTLTDEEKLELFRFTVEHVAGRCKVIAGTGSNNTAHTIQLSKEAERLGVDGLLLVAPYYNKPSQEGLYQHFSTIANSVSLPVVLYNVPSRTMINISTETTLRLAQIPNIVATKECAPLNQVAEIAGAAPAGFKVYSGDDSAALPAMAVGAHGVVSVASHIIGSPMKEMITAFFAGRVEEATKLHQRLLPIFKGLFEYPSPGPVKYALNLRGYSVGSVRLPLIPLTEAEAESIRELLN